MATLILPLVILPACMQQNASAPKGITSGDMQAYHVWEPQSGQGIYTSVWRYQQDRLYYGRLVKVAQSDSELVLYFDDGLLVPLRKGRQLGVIDGLPLGKLTYLWVGITFDEARLKWIRLSETMPAHAPYPYESSKITWTPIR